MYWLERICSRFLPDFYYWLPKMTGRLMDERLGTWSFWVMFIGLNLTFFPMHAARHSQA